MSPTILCIAGYRFFFFSREEPRPHVHVYHANGEGKIWLDPAVEIAHGHGLSARRLATILRLAQENEHEVRKAWKKHFGG